MKCLTLFTFFIALQGCMLQESGETETVKFYYESNTQMMILARQTTCYIFVLTPAEKVTVHTDDGLRNLELKLMAQINDPSTNYTTVPHFALHTNLNRQCGKDMTQYYIVQ